MCTYTNVPVFVHSAAAVLKGIHTPYVLTCLHLITTVDQEIFAVKIIRILNFRVKYFAAHGSTM